MLRALFLATTILVLPLGYASADVPPDPGANAALMYWQAFATLPKISDAEGHKLNAECLTMPLDAPARELVTKAEYSLEMMHHAAALPRCDWGINYDDGIYIRLPHAQAARVLSSLACLRARLRFEEGHKAEAIDDILGALALGRNVSSDGIMITLLVSYAIEHRMSETLAAYLPRLNAAMIKGLKTRLDTLPKGGSPARSLRTEEKVGLDWFIRQVKEALLTILAPLFLAPESAGALPGNSRAFLEQCGGTPAGVLKFAEEFRPSYAQMEQKLDLPPDQFAKEFEREAMKQARNPVFKLFFPGLEKVRLAQARADVRRALLSAAIAVQLYGRGALKNHADPVAAGPFEYVAFDGGYELRSKSKFEDKPLSLTVGLRGK